MTSAATSSPTVPSSPFEEEIDLELEQEIRREIEEIEELEREMGLRGPADARPRRGEEPARGGRSVRGRGLLKPPIQEIFRRGDEVLVQVIKESIGTKGPTLSTYISIPGRYLVLMPGLNRVGISRKIVDEGQRRKLREIMNELNPPKGLGFIVRTAGLGANQARAGPGSRVPITSLEGHPPANQEVQGADADLSRVGHDHQDHPRYLQLGDRHYLDRRDLRPSSERKISCASSCPGLLTASNCTMKKCRSFTSTASRTRSPRFSAGMSPFQKGVRS